MNQSNDREQSEFNMAVSYLNRLNALFYIADEAAMNLDVNKWMHSLKTIFRELSTEMNDQEIQNINSKFKTTNTDVQSYLSKSNQKGTQPISSKLYDGLHELEIDLRKILKDAGLQQKMKADSRKSLE